MLQYLLARATEPSSYAGAATLLGLLGVTIAPAEWQAIVGFLTALAGLLAIVLPEFGVGSTPPPPSSP
jgi:hypothetical protein